MASSFLLYADLTNRRVLTKVGGTNFSFPTFTGGETLSLAFRFCQTQNGQSTQVYPNVAAMRASIGFPDTQPTGGTFKLSVGGNVTAAIPATVSAANLQSALNAALTGGLTCQVQQDGISFVVTFSDGAAHAITPVANDLDPISLVRVREIVLADTVEHEISLVVAPLAATNVWNPIVPPAPSVAVIQQGMTSVLGLPSPTIQNLTIPSTFQGTFVLAYNNLVTSALSVDSGTSDIAAAINALFTGTGQTVTVLNPQTSVAQIIFDGAAFIGNPQPALAVSVLSAPPGDNTLVLDLNSSGCYEALRAADTITNLYLEVEADILPDGSNSTDSVNRQTVTLFRQKVSLQRPINWSGLEAASPINWAVPPGPSSYVPFDPSQIITGQQFYSQAVGDGAATVYTVTHNLGTSNLHLSLRNNATGALLVNGVDYHAAVTTNTVVLTFPSVIATGAVVVVISTAGPTSAFVQGLTISLSQVTGLSSQLQTITSTLNQLQAILPTTTGLGVTTSTTGVTYPLAVVAEIIGYQGTVTAGTSYLANQLPNLAPSLANSGNFTRELWNVPLNSNMLALGRTLSIDWGVALQAIRANCGIAYQIVVEIGTYTDDSNLNITWNTSSPVFSQTAVLTEELINHSFGIQIARVLSGSTDTLKLNQQLYGVVSGNNAAAPSNANFAIRCRLTGLTKESSLVQPDPRAWINYSLVPSVTATNGAAVAQAMIK